MNAISTLYVLNEEYAVNEGKIEFVSSQMHDFAL